MTPEDRLRRDRDAWKNAANHLRSAVRLLLEDHQPCNCFPCQAVKEYMKAQQGVSQ